MPDKEMPKEGLTVEAKILILAGGLLAGFVFYQILIHALNGEGAKVATKGMADGLEASKALVEATAKTATETAAKIALESGKTIAASVADALKAGTKAVAGA